MRAATGLAGIREAIGQAETLPAGTLAEGIVPVGIPEATVLGKMQAGTDQVGVLEAMLPEAMLARIVRVETRQLTGPEREVAGTVRQVAPLSVVRRAGNDHNRPGVRGQAA
jgi:hypothetical protein